MATEHDDWLDEMDPPRDRNARRERTDKIEQEEANWFRDHVVWGFYEEGSPKYTQGREGEHEICTPITAEEANSLVSQLEGLKGTTKDKIVELNVEELRKRSQTGLAKYGIFLEDAGLTKSELLQHLLEELLDAANYIRTLLEKEKDEESS